LLRAEAEKLGIDLSDIPLEYTEEGLQALNRKLNQVVSDGITDFNKGINNVEENLEEAREEVNKTSNAFEDLGDKDTELRNKFDDNQAFISRI
jgi:uncharacterized coiled-coil DUF342 family protein